MAKKNQIIDKEKVLESITKGKRAKWWQRKGGKKSGFRYVDVENKQIKDEKHLERIKSLVIPPAWKYVRIATSERSDLQAIGVGGRAVRAPVYFTTPRFVVSIKLTNKSTSAQF